MGEWRGSGERWTYHEQSFEVGEGLHHPDVLTQAILNHCVELLDHYRLYLIAFGGRTQLQPNLMRHHERHHDQHSPVVRAISRPMEPLRPSDEPQSHERDRNGVKGPHYRPTLEPSATHRVAAGIRGQTLSCEGFLDGAVGADASGCCSGEVGVGVGAVGVCGRAAVLWCGVCHAGRLCAIVSIRESMHHELARLTAQSGIVSARTTSPPACSCRRRFWPVTSAERADKQPHSSASLRETIESAISLRHVRDQTKERQKQKRAGDRNTQDSLENRQATGSLTPPIA